MKSLAGLVLALACSGCITSSQRIAANWILTPAEAPAATAKPTLGPARLAVVSVRAPYDIKSLAVLRADGSVAFDPYNQFAAAPAALVKGSALDSLRRMGLFSEVQPSLTTADVRTTLELTVEEMALDGRKEDELFAVVRLTLVMVRNREVVGTSFGEARVDATKGDYSAAFGTALAQAITQAASRFAK